MKKQQEQSIKVRLPEKVRSELDRAARGSGLTVSDLVRVAIKSQIPRWQKNRAVSVETI